MNQQIRLDRLEALCARFPSLLPTVKTLNEANISFAIAGSGCLYLFGNERVPNDIDFFLPDDQHGRADQVFGITSFTHQSNVNRTRNSNPGNDHDMQLTSQIVYSIGGQEYPFMLTEDVLSHRPTVDFQGQRIYLLPVEDVLLDKAMLQRGLESGKHDIEDIRNFLQIYSDIDRDYLKHRIHQLGAEERVGSIFD
jgi:predicted nucleotidyltransferase